MRWTQVHDEIDKTSEKYEYQLIIQPADTYMYVWYKALKNNE